MGWYGAMRHYHWASLTASLLPTHTASTEHTEHTPKHGVGVKRLRYRECPSCQAWGERHG